ncbi:MEDS domain-containing protein [Spirillospora sp. CA-128828]|uniref:MEDS domain-containing protein n=1 Tax=Spirillospora sp. CA-128828 TaxID=3240033 RepID=UPI003D94D1DC
MNGSNDPETGSSRPISMSELYQQIIAHAERATEPYDVEAGLAQLTGRLSTKPRQAATTRKPTMASRSRCRPAPASPISNQAEINQSSAATPDQEGTPGSPIRRPVSALRPGDHAWLVFSGEEERAHVVGDFVYDGLATDDKVVYVTDAAPERLPGVRPRPGIDLRAHTGTGQLRVISHARACLNGWGRFDPDRMLKTLEREVSEAFDQGFRAVRLTTDFSWVLNEPGPRGMTKLRDCQRRISETVTPSATAMAVCQVDRNACPPEDLLTLQDAPGVLVEANPEFDDGILRIVRTFEPHGLRVEGELDAARHAVFAEKLSLVIEQSRRIHLDFSGLGFIDLGGLSLLAHHATELSADETLLLDNLPPDVINVIEMVGWHRLPGLARGRPRHQDAQLWDTG